MSYIGNIPTNQAFVTDTFNGDGTTTAFTMSVAPASTSSILVAVTGVLQSPSTYSVSGTTLTFSSAPPVGTGSISVRYLGIPASGVTTTAYRTVTEFTATAGQTTFSVPSYTVGYIDVYRNGSRLNSADYTASTGTTVVLAAACNAGDSVTTESFYVSSVLNAIPATAGAVNATYLNTDAVTTAKIADANVTQAKLAAGVAGNGPAFQAAATGQTLSHNTSTKILFGSEAYDTAGCYDTSTSRFTPNVAGYYLVTTTVMQRGTAGRQYYFQTLTYKNGSTIGAYAIESLQMGTGGDYSTPITNIVYMNGTTDYLEVYAYEYDYTANSTTTILAGQTSVFQAVLVRSA